MASRDRAVTKPWQVSCGTVGRLPALRPTAGVDCRSSLARRQDDREHATLHPAEEVLGRDCEVYQEFVKYLHDHPAVIAEALLKVRLPWDVREAICRVVLFGVYG